MKLNEDHSVSIHIIDEWVYYSIYTSSFPKNWPRYRIRTDGTGKEEVK